MTAVWGDAEEPEGLTRFVEGGGVVTLLASGADDRSRALLRRTLDDMMRHGLCNPFLLVESYQAWKRIDLPFARWSSLSVPHRDLRSIVLQKFWDYRFRFYYLKKHYMLRLVSLGVSVFQMDTDVVINHNPLPILQSMHSALVVQHDRPFANAGVMFARPNSEKILSDLVWRIGLFQNHPDMSVAITRVKTSRVYGNFDDQTLLNDVLVSHALGRSVFHSTARYEHANRHNRYGPSYKNSSYKLQNERDVALVWRRLRRDTVRIDFLDKNASFRRFGTAFALAPFALFGFSQDDRAAIQHLAGIHGFANKLEFLKKRPASSSLPIRICDARHLSDWSPVSHTF